MSGSLHPKRFPGPWPAALLAALVSCSTVTLFESDFDATPSGLPPAAAQAVGTAAVDGPPGSVIVVDPPVTPSGKWVRVSRGSEPQSPVAGLQGNFSEFGGEGEYTFTTTVHMPAGSGIATLQCEPFGQPVGTLSSFLHIDLTRENDVRIDDKEQTRFGTFSRDQPFIVQLSLNIGPSSATAHIALAGAGASGEADYVIEPALLPLARRFGAIRIWMGFPSSGHFEATNIVVQRTDD